MKNDLDPRGNSIVDALMDFSAFNVLEGLREGFHRFSGATRIALLLASSEKAEPRIYDPQHLLRDHAQQLKAFYLDSPDWCKGNAIPLDLPHIIHSGVLLPRVYHRQFLYLKLFADLPQGMLNPGPLQAWLDYAALWLSRDLTTAMVGVNPSGSLRYAVEGYASYAISDYLRQLLQNDQATLIATEIVHNFSAISLALEEGQRSNGKLIIVDPKLLRDVEKDEKSGDVFRLVTRFSEHGAPQLSDSKHVGKLLQAVAGLKDAYLVSDGEKVVGLGSGQVPAFSLRAIFGQGSGTLSFDEEFVCRVVNGQFRGPDTEQERVRSVLWQKLEGTKTADHLLGIILELIKAAVIAQHGCTIVVDMNDNPMHISGHQLEPHLNLGLKEQFAIAVGLAKVDGAIHINAFANLVAFGCLLDGEALPDQEKRSRGARFNSALRFSKANAGAIVLVISSDGPTTIFLDGKPFEKRSPIPAQESVQRNPPTLSEWLAT